MKDCKKTHLTDDEKQEQQIDLIKQNLKFDVDSGMYNTLQFPAPGASRIFKDLYEDDGVFRTKTKKGGFNFCIQ